MGHIYERVKLTGEKSVTVDMFVDTGATYSMISEVLASEIGVSRAPRRGKLGALTITLADGRRKRFAAGTVFFTVAGREAASTVAIGDFEEPILGVETLEVLGLAVDPRGQRLRPTRNWVARA
jgi:predicted aspartyl protease